MGRKTFILYVLAQKVDVQKDNESSNIAQILTEGSTQDICELIEMYWSFVMKYRNLITFMLNLIFQA